MPHDKDPKPNKIEWKGGKRTPEQTRELNRRVLAERGLAYPGKQRRENLLKDIEPDSIVWARMKAKQIVERADYRELISALANINKVISDKKPKEMMEDLDKVVLAPENKSQLAPELELAMAFLELTDEDFE